MELTGMRWVIKNAIWTILLAALFFCGILLMFRQDNGQLLTFISSSTETPSSADDLHSNKTTIQQITVSQFQHQWPGNCSLNGYHFSLDTNRTSSRKSDCTALHYNEEKTCVHTALASFPGSGNTWIRHLIQQSTGIYTGSIYNSRILRKSGEFPGEQFQDGRVIAVKTHSYNQRHIQSFKRVILLVRNPFAAILAEYNRRMTNKTTSVDKSAFQSKDWKIWAERKARSWRGFNLSWLKAHKCVYVLMYEDLKRDLAGQMQKLASALGLTTPLSEDHMKCLVNNSKGNYKRTKPSWMQPATNVYSEKQKHKIRSNIKKVNNLLKLFNMTITES